LYPDAVELLRVVKQQQLPTALVTNGASDSQRGKLDALGLEGVFDAVVVSGEIGAAKPDVAPFRVALRTLGMDGDNVWHVGDSLASDVAGANAAGLASVWLNRHGRERPVGAPNPAVEIRSLTEIADTLTDTR
jgi:putative hydrolase of the HAD superfamily